MSAYYGPQSGGTLPVATNNDTGWKSNDIINQQQTVHNNHHNNNHRNFHHSKSQNNDDSKIFVGGLSWVCRMLFGFYFVSYARSFICLL